MESRKVYKGLSGIKGSIFKLEGDQGKYIQFGGESMEIYSGWRGIKGSIRRLDGNQGK